MKGFAWQQTNDELREAFLYAMVIVGALEDDPWPPKGAAKLTCHVLARVVDELLPEDITRTVQSGRVGFMEHSWLWLMDGWVLDPYTPGQVPMVSLVYPDRARGAYVGGPPRRRRTGDREMIDAVVSELRDRGIEKALHEARQPRGPTT